MRPLLLIRLLTLALALAVLGPTAAVAESGDVITVMPADLKWTDATSMPPGAKIGVIEDQQTKQPQYILPSSFPPSINLPPLASGDRAYDGDIGHFQFRDGRQA
jgi:hypothetical protein